MRAYIAYIKTTLRLTMRDRQVLFFNFLFPAIFFFIFAQSFRAGQSQGAITIVLTMVLVINVLGAGFFGGGLRATMEREANILRRFKVAPIGPGPILVASLVVGWLVFIPSALLFVLIAHFRYGFVIPPNLFSVLLLLSAGILAFRAAGLIVASVANSMAESQIIVQILYMPMLFLSGATFPQSFMPEWVQAIAQFLPSTHLFLGMQSIMLRGETILQNGVAVGALLGVTVIGYFLSMKLFRWEKEEKIKASAKLWILAIIIPFVLIGTWQVKSKENLQKSRIIARQVARSRAYLIRGARLFAGDGKVIESGAVLVKDGKIVNVFEGASPDAEDLNAEPIEASGKTILPGLIDTRVHLALPVDPANADPTNRISRALAAYLYAGVTAVRSAPDPTGVIIGLRSRFESGEKLGAELFLAASVGSDQPSLAAIESTAAFLAGDPSPLDRTLVQQIGPADLIAAMKRVVAARTPKIPSSPAPRQTVTASAVGTDSGNALLLHGPAIHRELQLWVQAGVAPAAALQAATGNAAALLRASDRIGMIKPGLDASLLIVEGNPLADISVTERIFLVLFKGERVDRTELFEDFDKKK